MESRDSDARVLVQSGVMTAQFRTDIDALTTPSSDGRILIWPPPEKLLHLAEENRRRLAQCDSRLLDRPIKSWLQSPSTRPLVFLTGHQPEFFHPGVWSKNVVAAALAKRVGSMARFLVVDSDVPHQIFIQWPEASEDKRFYRVRRRSAASVMKWQSYESIVDHASIDYERLFSALPNAFRKGSSTVLSDFEAGFLDSSNHDPESRSSYVQRWMRGLEAVEQTLDVASPTFIRVSNVFSWNAEHHSDEPDVGSAAAFVAHLLVQADSFSTAYNMALEMYRSRRGIAGRRHPIPDLKSETDRVELPFWLIHATQQRQRLMVSRSGSADTGIVRLWADQQNVCKLPLQDLRRDPAKTLAEGLGDYQIRPRALTQTLYARLFLGDLFIHGIGGAKYDQITDQIMRLFFGVDPPAYACVSATLWLDIRRYGVSESHVQALRHKVRDFAFNPQRYLTGVDQSEPLRKMISERKEAIEESNRLRRDRSKDRSARREAFNRIHRANTVLLKATSSAFQQTHRELSDLSDQLTHNQVAESREWFFAMYPKEKLQRLRDKLTRCFQ